MEASDEYTVLLPRNEGKHNDLREVQFFLGSKYGGENTKANVVSVRDASSQGVSYTLAIKGSENWQLQHPSGERSIKAIVCDMAGLKSNEEGKSAKRIFTSITLVPSSTTMSLSEGRDDGVLIPAIKELEEFFKGEDWKRAGYSVEYSLPAGFSYSSGDKFRIDASVVAGTPYAITVSLNQNGNVRTATYTVNFMAQNEAEIDLSKLKIEDVSDYVALGAISGAAPLSLSGNTLIFNEVAGVKKATLKVPYTGFATNMDVDIKAISKYGKIQDEHHIGDASAKKFSGISLAQASGSTMELKFWVVAEDGVSQKEHSITFERDDSVELKLILSHELLDSPNGKATLSSRYQKLEIESNVGPQTQVFRVAKNSVAELCVIAGSEARVGKCEYTNTAHSATYPIAITEGGGNANISATEDYEIKVALRADAVAIWEDYNGATPPTHGYTSGKISYYKNGALQNEVPGNPDNGRAVQNGSELVFEVEGVNFSTHNVKFWKVNGEEISADRSYGSGSITFENNKTKLKISNARGDYRVSVSVVRFYKVEVEIVRPSGFASYEHAYTLETRVAGALRNADGAPSTSGDVITYTFNNVDDAALVAFKAIEGAGSKFNIEKWEYRLGASPFASLATTTIDKKNASITSLTADAVVRITLEIKKYRVSFDGENGTVDISGMVYTASGASSPLPGGSTYTMVEIGGKIVLNKGADPTGRVMEGWRVAGILYSAHGTSGDVEMTGMDSITVSNIHADTNIKVVFKLKKYIVKVVIKKPTGDSAPHKYKVKMAKGSSDITNIPNTSTETIEYTYSHVEHDSVLTFTAEAEADSKYERDKWQWKLGGASSPTDMPAPNQDTKTWIVTGNAEIILLLKKKTYTVGWSIQNGNGTKISVDGSAPSATAGSKTVEIDASVGLIASDIPEGHYIEGWKVGGVLYEASDASKDITIGGADKQTLTIDNIKENKTIILSVVKKKYTLKVNLEKPAACTDPIDRTIKLYKGSTEISASSVSGTTYTFSDIEHGTNLKIVAVSGGPKYIVEKWEYKKDDSSFGEITEPALGGTYQSEKQEVSLQLKKDLEVRANLVQFVTFEFEKKGNKGKLEIKKDGDSSTQTLNATGSKKIAIAGNTATFTLEVKELNLSDNKVVSWTLNGVMKDSSPYLKNDGFWENRVDETFNAGDVVKVTVNKVYKMVFKATGTGDQNDNYTGNFKISVKKNAGDTDPNHVFLPMRTLEVTNSNAPADSRTIYATQNTKIDISMTELGTNKEIWKWRRGNVTLNGHWNTDGPNDIQVLGKEEISGYMVTEDLGVNACITDKRCVVETGVDKSSVKENDEEYAKKIKIKVSYSTDSSGTTFTQLGTAENLNAVKYRVKKGSKIKFEIESNAYAFDKWNKEQGNPAGVSDQALSFTLNEDIKWLAKMRVKLRVRYNPEPFYDAMWNNLNKLEALLVDSSGTVKETKTVKRDEWVFFDTPLSTLGTLNGYEIDLKFTFKNPADATTKFELSYKKDGNSTPRTWWYNAKTIKAVADGGGLSGKCAGADWEITIDMPLE